jgi:hypothetical protein
MATIAAVYVTAQIVYIVSGTLFAGFMIAWGVEGALDTRSVRRRAKYRDMEHLESLTPKQHKWMRKQRKRMDKEDMKFAKYMAKQEAKRAKKAAKAARRKSR